MAKTIKQKFIIDESGSMDPQRMVVINGFNEQLDDMIREEKELGVKYLVTLVKFSHNVTTVFKDRPVAEVPRLTKQNYKPNGSTALYDAVGETISSAYLGESDVIVTIMSDGQENASRNYKKAAIQAIIDIRQNENKWAFVYFGANQDAWAEASSMGVSNAVNYTVANTGLAMNAMSTVRCAYTSSAITGNYQTSNLASTIDESELVK